MATQTLTFECIGSALANASQKSTNFSAADKYLIDDDGSKLYLRFAKFPENLKRNVLLTAYVREYWDASVSVGSTYLIQAYLEACGEFDESTLTYANAPATIGPPYRLGRTEISNLPNHGSGNPANMPNIFEGTSAPQAAKLILQKSCVNIENPVPGSNTYLYLYTRKSAAKKPLLFVQYDDSRIVDYKVAGTSRTSGWVNKTILNIFSWKIEKTVSGDYCVADPKQASAVFHWRLGSSGEVHEIPVEGSNTFVGVPANTFPGGSIQWWVTAVDDYGITLTEKAVYTIDTLAGPLKASPSSPIAGAFLDPLEPGQFMWSLSNSHNILVQKGAELQYSSDGTTWTALGSVEGDSQSFTSPANTFGTGTYYWRVRAWNADGEAGPWSSAATFSTVDAPMSAIPERPVSEICEVNRPITFSWGYSSDTGTVPERSDLQYSRDANSWTDLATVTGRVFTYTVPADFFLAGTVYWRARAYNHNNVVGSWSDAVSFIVFGAPHPPSVSVDAVPFAVIRWQVPGQEAYKVTVDGVEYGAYFGSAKSFEVPEPLEPGRHSASVVVQGQYGLWSPAGEIVFDVTNVPGASVDLTGSFGRDAALSWETASQAADFLIYRDGVRIGHTRGNSFTDRAALGYHSYSVLNRLPGGYYTASYVVSGTMHVDCLALAPLRGGEGVDLALSENSDDAVTYTETQQVSLRQFAGRDYPTAERSRYKTRVARFNAAWEHESADALAFEAMLGEMVIYKHRDGHCFVGVLSAFELASKKFYKAYAASVQQSTWKEYTDADS